MMSPKFALLFAAAAMVGAVSAVEAGNTNMPIYCRLLQKGLAMATNMSIMEDTNVSITTHHSGMGDMLVSAAHLEISRIDLVDCEAFLSGRDTFSVQVKDLTIHLHKLDWSYAQQSFPHVHDNGEAKGTASVSFNISIHPETQIPHVFGMKIGEIDITPGAEHHKWLTAALMKLTKIFRPIITTVVQNTAEKTMESSLAIIKDEGGCAFLHDILAKVDMTKLAFNADNITAHEPIIGDVHFTLDSTYVSQPHSMSCKQVGFNGQMLIADVEQVPFSVGFKWSYRKAGSKFWHNQGNGTAAVVGGTSLHIDLLNPEKTVLQVMLPVLNVKLDAESHAWMYHAVTDLLVPLVRETLQVAGGKRLTLFLKKCLEDPTCPHMHSQVPKLAPLPSAADVTVVV